jgi:tetratricopeptide (TPR) repeat protein
MAFVMNKATCILALGLVVLCSSSYAATADTTTRPIARTVAPRELAREAYYQIEANVFDRAQLQDAYTKINLAADQNRNEAFIYVAVSLGTLAAGYTIGDWYDLTTFPGDVVQQALAHARQGVALDPNLGQAHAQLARLLIVKKEFHEAAEHITKAKELDPNSFYPWYFEGIWHEKQGHVAEASQAFDHAQGYAARPHHPMLILKHREYVAKLGGNFALQEKLLKDSIGLNPDSAYSYGSYAAFLMCQGRYREAVVQWEKAIRITPYGRAVSQLEQAKQYLAQEKTKIAQTKPKTGCA